MLSLHTSSSGLELVELHFILQLVFKQLEAISLHFQVSLGLYTAVQGPSCSQQQHSHSIRGSSAGLPLPGQNKWSNTRRLWCSQQTAGTATGLCVHVEQQCSQESAAGTSPWEQSLWSGISCKQCELRVALMHSSREVPLDAEWDLNGQTDLTPSSGAKQTSRCSHHLPASGTGMVLHLGKGIHIFRSWLQGNMRLRQHHKGEHVPWEHLCTDRVIPNICVASILQMLLVTVHKRYNSCQH